MYKKSLSNQLIKKLIIVFIIGGFQGLFGSSNFMIVDNNDYQDEKAAQKRFNMLVRQGLGKFIKRPIKNKRGQNRHFGHNPLGKCLF